MLNTNLKYLPTKDADGKMVDYKSCIFLKHFITKTNIIEVGDYTYYATTANATKDSSNFENENVLYAFDGARLVFGKFCQLAQDCKFMLQFADHHMNSFTTYPLFWNKLEEVNSYFECIPDKKYFIKEYGPTLIGNDVWIGYDALIMPSVKIGDGAIIGARSLVTKDVEPYTIVAGNPAKVIRKRFPQQTIDKLLKIQWWNWEIEKIMMHYDDIMNCEIDKLV
jgi:virginiamycin A acetyltransferase